MKLSELQQISQLFVAMSHEEAFASNQAFQEAAAHFQANLNTMLTPDSNGVRPPFDNNALRKVLVDIGGIRRHFPKTGVNEAVKENFEQSISAVEHLFSCLNVKKGTSLDVCIRDTEPVSIQTSQELDQVGGAVSKRDMVTLQKASGNVEGFYTKSETFLQVPQEETDLFKEILEEVKEDPQAAAFADKVMSGKFGLYALNMSAEEGAKTDDGAEELCRSGYDPQRLEAYGFLDGMPGGTPKEKFDALLENHGIARLMANAWLRMPPNKEPYMNDHKLYGKGAESGIEVEAGSSRSGRNVAMSRVANLLGAGDRLAHSSNVSLQYEDGTTTRGVFMEKAEGIDLPDLSLLFKSDFMKIHENSFDGEGLKSVSEMQFVDVVCQNVDRHTQNMLYTFDENQNLVKVEGIDHDYSFGTVKPGNDTAKQYGTPLDDINVVSESMKESMLALNPEALKSALADTGLTEAEIRAAQERLQMLQERLAVSTVMKPGEKPEYGKIKVVPDDMWKTLKVEDLVPAIRPGQKEPQGTFAMLQKAKNAAILGRDYWKDVQKDPKRFEEAKNANYVKENEKAKEFGQGTRVNELTTDQVNRTIEELKAFNKELKDTQGLFHRSKSQFKDLRFAMDELEALNLTPGQDLSEPQMINIYEKLQNAVKTVDAYIEYKEKDNDTSATGTERLDIARRLKKRLDDRFNNFSDAYHEFAESALEEAYENVQEANTRFNGLAEKVADLLVMHQEGLTKEEAIAQMEKSGALRRMLESDGAVEKYEKLLTTNPDKVYQDYQACHEMENTLNRMEGGEFTKAQIAENIYSCVYKGARMKSDAQEYQKEVKEIFEDPVNKIRGIQQIMKGKVFQDMVKGKTDEELQRMEVRPLETYKTYLQETKALEKQQPKPPKMDTRDLLYPDIQKAMHVQTAYSDGSAIMDVNTLKNALDKIKNPLNFSITRSAFSAVAMAQMISDGMDIDQVMNPDMLKKEKLEYAKKAMVQLNNGDGKTIAQNFLKAQDKLVTYMDEHMTQLKSMTLPELMKDANMNLLGVFRLSKDISQECDRTADGESVKFIEKYFTPEEKKAMDRLNDEFEAVNLPVQMMDRATKAINNLYQGKGKMEDLTDGLITLALQDQIMQDMHKDPAVAGMKFSEAMKTGDYRLKLWNASSDITVALKNTYDEIDSHCLDTPQQQKAIARSFMDGSANKKFNFKVEEIEYRGRKQMGLNSDALVKSANSHFQKVAPEKVSGGRVV